MPLLGTARKHFDNDLCRARELASHADAICASVLRNDIFRAAWMMSVGAADAFFCDVYADLIARTLQAKQLQDSLQLSDRMLNLRVPAIAVVGPAASANWRWRMAARQIIEDESVLSLKEIKTLLNQFFRDDRKPFSNGNIDLWIVRPRVPRRLFGIAQVDYRRLTGKPKKIQRAACKLQFEKRYEAIFQRRHDAIHNCDRPKAALNDEGLSLRGLTRVIDDIEFLGARIAESVDSEFPDWMSSLGATANTRNRVTQ